MAVLVKTNRDQHPLRGPRNSHHAFFRLFFLHASERLGPPFLSVSVRLFFLHACNFTVSFTQPQPKSRPQPRPTTTPIALRRVYGYMRFSIRLIFLELVQTGGAGAVSFSKYYYPACSFDRKTELGAYASRNAPLPSGTNRNTSGAPFGISPISENRQARLFLLVPRGRGEARDTYAPS